MKLPQRFKGELFLSLVRTFLARGVVALGGLLLFMVLGRLYGPAGLGVFALAQSIYIGSGILARYGMNNSLMRYVGQDYESKAIISYLRWAVVRSLWLSLIASLLIFLSRSYLSKWFDAIQLDEVLSGIAIAVPAHTIAVVLAGFMKGVRKPATACLLENGIVSFIACGIVLVLNSQFPESITNAGWALALASWLVLVLGAWQVWSWLHGQELCERKNYVSNKEFSSSSQTFFIISLAQFMQQVVAVVIAGWLLSSEEFGLFRSAERMAMLISFILMVLNSILPPRFASLYHNDDLKGLAVLSRKGALLGIGLASPLLLACLFMPHLVLGLFGQEFIQGANLLRIIAVAQLINVATGSVNYLLNMTGHEKLMRNIALICNALGPALFFILIPSLGALGAAWALAIVLVLQSLTALVFVWRKLGIWILPIPNFLKWMHNSVKETA